MPKRKLGRKNVYIQVVVNPDDRAAFDAWCEKNNTTMSEIIRQQIAVYVTEGKKILEVKGEYTVN
jgi:hypothetical protein